MRTRVFAGPVFALIGIGVSAAFVYRAAGDIALSRLQSGNHFLAEDGQGIAAATVADTSSGDFSPAVVGTVPPR